MNPWLPDVADNRAIWGVLATLIQDVADLRERVSALESAHAQKE